MRLGDARGRGHVAVAGTAGARTLWESTARGLMMPGVMGMAQSLELPELGPHGNWQLEDWGSQGSWAWGSRWNCEGLDPTGNRSLRIGDTRGCGHGCSRRNCEGLDRARTRTPRTRIEEDEEWGYGLTVPRSERSPMLDVCETLGFFHQVWPDAEARPRRSFRASSPFETPFEHAIEPAIATSSEG